MKIKCMINRYKATSKDNAVDNVGKIKFNKSNSHKSDTREYSIEEISSAILLGKTIIPAIMTNGTTIKEDNFIEQQLFGVDIDNKEDSIKSYTELLDLCNIANIKPFLIHESFRSTKENPKYRMLFATKECIKDKEAVKSIIQNLIKALSIDNITICDTSCSDLGRLFFAGKTINYASEDYLDIQMLLKHSNTVISCDNKVKPMKFTSNGGSHSGAGLEQLIIKGLSSDELRGGQSLEVVYIFQVTVRGVTQHGSNKVESMPLKLFMETTSKLPLDIILGVKLGSSFSCLLPDHDDRRPSANVGKLMNGKYLYNCLGCRGLSEGLDIFHLYSIATGKSIAESISCIAKILNITLESNYRLEAISTITDNMIFIESEYFKEQFKVHKELVRANALLFYEMLLIYAQRKMGAYCLTGLEGANFFVSIRELSRMLTKRNIRGASKDAVHKKITYLCKLGLIQKVDYDDISEEANLEIEKHRKRQISKLLALRHMKESDRHKIEKHYKKQSFYTILPLTAELLLSADKIIDFDRDNSVRRSFQSREQLLRAYGEDMADGVYVQDKGRVSEKVNKFYDNYRIVAESIIDKKGYFTEKELITKIRGYSKYEKTTMSGQCLPQLIQELSATKKRLNKQVRATYKVPSSVKSNSIIFTY